MQVGYESDGNVFFIAWRESLAQFMTTASKACRAEIHKGQGTQDGFKKTGEESKRQSLRQLHEKRRNQMKTTSLEIQGGSQTGDPQRRRKHHKSSLRCNRVGRDHDGGTYTRSGNQRRAQTTQKPRKKNIRNHGKDDQQHGPLDKGRKMGLQPRDRGKESGLPSKNNKARRRRRRRRRGGTVRGVLNSTQVEANHIKKIYQNSLYKDYQKSRKKELLKSPLSGHLEQPCWRLSPHYLDHLHGT